MNYNQLTLSYYLEEVNEREYYTNNWKEITVNRQLCIDLNMWDELAEERFRRMKRIVEEGEE